MTRTFKDKAAAKQFVRKLEKQGNFSATIESAPYQWGSATAPVKTYHTVWYLAKRKTNPTKAQKREKAKKASAKRRLAEALKNFVRKANPAAKGVVKATKVKGGWNVRVVDVRRTK